MVRGRVREESIADVETPVRAVLGDRSGARPDGVRRASSRVADDAFFILFEVADGSEGPLLQRETPCRRRLGSKASCGSSRAGWPRRTRSSGWASSAHTNSSESDGDERAVGDPTTFIRARSPAAGAHSTLVVALSSGDRYESATPIARPATPDRERREVVNVLVFGAGGATGRLLVDEALRRRHRVRAFVRSPTTWPRDGSGLSVVRGDVRDTDAVDAAVEGQDAVICALGAATPLRRDRALVDGIRNIVETMQRQGVRRLVYLSFLGVHESRAQLSALGRWVVAPLLMRNVVADHEAKERIIRASSLDWVIVRPPRLTDGERRVIFRKGVGIPANEIVPRISRADLADFMLRQISDDTYLRQAPAVMY